jgi:hypothetical protein
LIRAIGGGWDVPKGAGEVPERHFAQRPEAPR